MAAAKPPGYVYHRQGVPVAWFYMREARPTFPGDAGDVADITGRVAAGERTDVGCDFVPGPRGKRLAFDGAQFVNFGKQPSLRFTEAVTVSARVQTTNAGSSFRGICANEGGWSIFLIDNEYCFYDWFANVINHSGFMANDGLEHTLTTVFRGGVAGGSEFFVDGRKVGVGTWTNNDGPSGLVQIGNNGGITQQYSGFIDDVRVFDYPLSAAEIRREAADPFWRLRPPRRKTAWFAGSPTPTPTASPAALLMAM